MKGPVLRLSMRIREIANAYLDDCFTWNISITAEIHYHDLSTSGECLDSDADRVIRGAEQVFPVTQALHMLIDEKIHHYLKCSAVNARI